MKIEKKKQHKNENNSAFIITPVESTLLLLLPPPTQKQPQALLNHAVKQGGLSRLIHRRNAICWPHNMF